MRKLRWGLLGTARINRAIIPVLQSSERNEAAAVASRSAEAAEAYAREWDIPRAVGGYAALLADPDLDVIYVPLPNALHAEWTIKAAQAGKHVLCEKPLAMSPAEVDAVADAAHAHHVVVAEAFMYRHHPLTLRVRDLVADGAIGELRLVRGAFTFNLNRPNDVRLDPALGGGSIWDIGCYPISYARFVAGAEPVEVLGQQITGPTGVDMAFFGQMRFPGGVYAQFDSSFSAAFRTHIEIVGSEGKLEVPRPYKPGLHDRIWLTRDDKTDTVTLRGQEPYHGEVEDMADAILTGQAPRVSLSDSRGNAAAIAALVQSAAEGRPIALAQGWGQP